MTQHTLFIQRLCEFPDLPTDQHIEQWVTTALNTAKTADREITVRIVDEPEMTELNQTYRKKQGPTNVLSFPYALPKGIPSNLLGDIVLCAPVIAKQAIDLNISLQSHWAHLIIHGTLHLLGYDHIRSEDAAIMEALETNALKQLGFHNPYTNESTCHDG